MLFDADALLKTAGERWRSWYTRLKLDERDGKRIKATFFPNQLMNPVGPDGGQRVPSSGTVEVVASASGLRFERFVAPEGFELFASEEEYKEVLGRLVLAHYRVSGSDGFEPI